MAEDSKSKKAQNNPIISHNRQTESYKRPNHPDFWDASECKKNEFSGVRKNDMALRWEFWILGEMVKEVSYLEVSKDQFALTKAHCEVFYITPDAGLFKRDEKARTFKREEKK